MKRYIACIVCPKSCELSVEEISGAIEVAGNQCQRGAAFAEQEINDPRRILTTTVKLTNGGLLPVRSREPVKKAEMKAIVERLRLVTVAPPVEIGQIIVQSVGSCAVDIIATDNV